MILSMANPPNIHWPLALRQTGPSRPVPDYYGYTASHYAEETGSHGDTWQGLASIWSCVLFGLKPHNISRRFNAVAGLTGIIKQSKDVTTLCLWYNTAVISGAQEREGVGGVCHRHGNMLITDDGLADSQNTLEQRLYRVRPVRKERAAKLE